MTSQPISYSIPVPTSISTCTVRLHFAEIYFPDVYEGSKQVFDVKIEGSTVQNNFCITTATGAVNKAHVLEFTNVSNDGTITVEIVPELGSDSVYRGVINGIEIMKP